MHQTMRAAPCAWLVFLLLAPNLLSATADKCKSSDVNLSEGEEKKVDTSYGGYVTWQSLFLHLKEGFKGMDLKISGGSGEVIMSFDAEIECFRQGTHWYKMHFTCGYTVDSEYVWCAIVGGDCRWHCSKKYTSNGSIKLIVIAKGPSEWKLDTPNLDTCPRRDVTWLTRNRNHSMGIVACNLKDAAMPGDDSTMVLAVVLPVVVLVVLVAVIVMVMKKSNSCQERIPFLMPTRHTPRMRPLPAASPPLAHTCCGAKQTHTHCRTAESRTLCSATETRSHANNITVRGIERLVSLQWQRTHLPRHVRFVQLLPEC
ncbi:uncharacterized protein LOC135104777 isoform X1 [Scylla paramamosain]|uniref:uncharacterized protein LOC135104777 isoform X1 n=1 Tax=Scylla paramamosain TaxID=85552 RepID=UPI0030832362